MSSEIMIHSIAAPATTIAPPLQDSSVICMLDLPIGSSLTCDGHTIRLQRDDFVGICDLSLSEFHLMVVRAASSHGASAVSVGFVLATSSPELLARRYDPTTEEVSAQPLDELTLNNLKDQINSQQLEPQRVVSYHNIVNPEACQAWKHLTSFISHNLLQKRGISSGAKIVPGSYQGPEEHATTGTMKLSSKSKQESQAIEQDGTAVNYPPIPVLDNSHHPKSKATIRHAQHAGTKRFLAHLPPAERTALFLRPDNHNHLLKLVLEKEYANNWHDLLGDLQLSYVLFLHLHCLNSLEHWRDLVAMLSHVDCHGMGSHLELYTNLLDILARQVTTIEEDFFEDMELSGDNFLLPALLKLCQTTGQIQHDNLQTARTNLCRILQNRFRNAFEGFSSSSFDSDNNSNTNNLTATTTAIVSNRMQVDHSDSSDDEDDENDEDEDMPVVVSTEEIEASSARNKSSLSSPSKKSQIQQEYPPSLQNKYPVLFAAKMEHEDIMMTCARALDDATDVSLVREAGTFLVEEVEPQPEVFEDS